MGHYAGEFGETPEEALKRERYGRIHKKLGEIPLAGFMAKDLLPLAKFLGITKYGPSEDDLVRIEEIIREWESLSAEWALFQQSIQKANEEMSALRGKGN